MRKASEMQAQIQAERRLIRDLRCDLNDRSEVPLVMLEGRIIEIYVEFGGGSVTSCGEVRHVPASNLCWIGELNLKADTIVRQDDVSGQRFHVTAKDLID